MASPSGHAQSELKPTLIDSIAPFSSDGKIEMTETKLLRTTEVSKTEAGVINGVHYHFYYTDGSGTFSGRPGNTGHHSEPTGTNWTTGCKKDPVTDRKHCYMQIRDLWIFVQPKGQIAVSIGHDHFPGSTVTIRLDNAPPISTGSRDDGTFNKQISAKLIKQLAQAKLATTRYMKWPYRTWVDETWELYGLPETLQYINWAVERIK